VIAEKMGVPGLAVMTTRFVSAAKLMCRVLGMPDYGFAVIDHPISSASDAQLEAMARATMADARRLLLQG
jgi:hypothetical protein